MLVRKGRNGVGKGDVQTEFGRGFGRRVAIIVLIVLVGEAWRASGLSADGTALLEFKDAITSDPQDALRTWNGADATPCSWTGINCKTIPGFQEDRVVDIVLPRYALEGTLSPSLGDLAYLETVNLDSNQLSGGLPRELFNAANISSLSLSNNKLSGDIPTEIRYLGQQLRVLEVNGNSFTSLPESIVYCSHLQRLLLNDNNITGLLPVGAGSNWTQLERLDLSVNRFSGPVPGDFGNLTALQGTLNLSSNHLSGPIPPFLAQLQDVFIDFSHNNFSGSIPSISYFQSLGEPAFLGNAALCGSPLKIECSPPPSPSASAPAAGSGLSKVAVICIAVGSSAAGFLLMATLVFYLVLRKLALAKKNLPRSDSALRGCLCSWRESVSGRLSGDDEEGEGELMHLSGVFSFSLEELLRASAYVLGKNGVGIVYKAVLDEGTVVAVRRLGGGRRGEHRQKEFEAEVKTVAHVRHSNIVCLHSVSWTSDEILLVYDYLSNGSLEMALYGRPERSKGFLTWEARLRIARGVAHGIAHIHECSSKNYVHGDIKTANILLDAFLEPRIADFGLQRLLSLVHLQPVKEFGSTRGDYGIRVTSPAGIGRRRSSPGEEHMVGPVLMGVYQAPEAEISRRLTQKSDVYSFGVVLLELLTGRSPYQQLAAGELDLVSWMRVALHEKKAFSEIFDPCLQKSSSEQSKMIETLQVALACIAVNPESRPKMKQVAEMFGLLAS